MCYFLVLLFVNFISFFSFICEVKEKKETKQRKKRKPREQNDNHISLAAENKRRLNEFWRTPANACLHYYGAWRWCKNYFLIYLFAPTPLTAPAWNLPFLWMRRRQIRLCRIKYNARQGIVVIRSIRCFLFLFVLFFLLASEIRRKKSTKIFVFCCIFNKQNNNTSKCIFWCVIKTLQILTKSKQKGNF